MTAVSLAASKPLPPAEEARLIEAARGGDTRAFSALVFVHQRNVRAYLGGFISRTDVVDDLAQEAFLAAFFSLDSFKADGPFGAWLLGIARNKLLMHLRSQARRSSHEGGPLDAALEPFREAIVEDGETQLLVRQQELEALARCLERLPGASAEIVSEHYLKARPLVEIARQTGRGEGALRMALLRVRQVLRDCMERGPAPEGAR